MSSDYIDYRLDPRVTVHVAYPDADPQVFGPQYPTTYFIIPKSSDISLIHTPGSFLYSNQYLTHLIESFDKPIEDRKSFFVRMFYKIFRLD